VTSNTQITDLGALPPTPEAHSSEAPATEPRKKTMSEAALAANRANAQKSTGPRTAAGKARSASNAFQHGLYSMRSFSHMLGDPNLIVTVEHNFLQEYRPVTPTEHMLVQQLIHLQLRFIQMEFIFNQALHQGCHNEAPRGYIAVLRELDRIPNRILKVIKALREQIALRDKNTEIEPIEDPPPVDTVNQMMAKMQDQPETFPSGPKLGETVAQYIYREVCRRTGVTPQPIPERKPTPAPATSNS
jgi:hypothetical protein